MDIVTFALLGLAVGSFLNVVIIRLPKGENIAFPSSHCVKCNRALKWYHNIPLFSWLFLKGKCAFCGEKISIQYPLVEFFTMLLFIVSYLKMGNFIYGIVVALLFSSFFAMSLIDLKYKVAPDSLNLLALYLSIFTSFSFLNNFVNILLFIGGFYLLSVTVSLFIGKDALGEADIIVAGTIGGLLGLKYGVVAIFLSAFIALPAFTIVKEREDFQLPYIPFLAIATFIVFMFPKEIDLVLDFVYR